jgi:hypothetical protein
MKFSEIPVGQKFYPRYRSGLLYNCNMCVKIEPFYINVLEKPSKILYCVEYEPSKIVIFYQTFNKQEDFEVQLVQ